MAKFRDKVWGIVRISWIDKYTSSRSLNCYVVEQWNRKFLWLEIHCTHARKSRFFVCTASLWKIHPEDKFIQLIGAIYAKGIKNQRIIFFFFTVCCAEDSGLLLWLVSIGYFIVELAWSFWWQKKKVSLERNEPWCLMRNIWKETSFGGIEWPLHQL